MAKKASTKQVHTGDHMTAVDIHGRGADFREAATKHIMENEGMTLAAVNQWFKRGLKSEEKSAGGQKTFAHHVAEVVKHGSATPESEAISHGRPAHIPPDHVEVIGHTQQENPTTTHTQVNSDVVHVSRLAEHLNDLQGTEVEIHQPRLDENGEWHYHQVSGHRPDENGPWRGLEGIGPATRKAREATGRPLETVSKQGMPEDGGPLRPSSRVSGPLTGINKDTGLQRAQNRYDKTRAALESAQGTAFNTAVRHLKDPLGKGENRLADYGMSPTVVASLELGGHQPPSHPGPDASPADLANYETGLSAHQKAVSEVRSAIRRHAGPAMKGTTEAVRDEEGNVTKQVFTPDIETDAEGRIKVDPQGRVVPTRENEDTFHEKAEQLLNPKKTNEGIDADTHKRIVLGVGVQKAASALEHHPEVVKARAAHDTAKTSLRTAEDMSRKKAIFGVGGAVGSGGAATPVEALADTQEKHDETTGAESTEAILSGGDIGARELKFQAPGAPSGGAKVGGESSMDSFPEDVTTKAADKLLADAGHTPKRRGAAVGRTGDPNQTQLEGMGAVKPVQNIASRGPDSVWDHPEYHAANLLHGLAHAHSTGDPSHLASAVADSTMMSGGHISEHPVGAALLDPNANLQQIAQNHNIDIGTGSLSDISHGALTKMRNLEERASTQTYADARGRTRRSSAVNPAPAPLPAETTKSTFHGPQYGRVTEETEEKQQQNAAGAQAILDAHNVKDQSGNALTAEPTGASRTSPSDVALEAKGLGSWTALHEMEKNRESKNTPFPGRVKGKKETLATERTGDEDEGRRLSKDNEKQARIGPQVEAGRFGVRMGTAVEDLPHDIHHSWELVPEHEDAGNANRIQGEAGSGDAKLGRQFNRRTSGGSMAPMKIIDDLTRQQKNTPEFAEASKAHDAMEPAYRHEIANRLLHEAGRGGENPAGVSIRPASEQTRANRRFQRTLGGLPVASQRLRYNQRQGGRLPYSSLRDDRPADTGPTPQRTDIADQRAAQAASADREVAAKFHGVEPHKLTDEQVRTGVAGAQKAVTSGNQPVQRPGYQTVASAIDEATSQGRRYGSGYKHVEYVQSAGAPPNASVSAGAMRTRAAIASASRTGRAAEPYAGNTPATTAMAPTSAGPTQKNQPVERAAIQNETLQDQNQRMVDLKITSKTKPAGEVAGKMRNAREVGLNRSRKR